MREPQVMAVNYIEKTFNQIIKDIHIRPCGHPSIVLKRIAHVKSPGSDNSWEVADRQTKITFPGKNKDEAWRFACVGKLLSEIYTALKTGQVVTKRDIYYRDPELFRSQSVVDRYVDVVAYTCGVTRLDLNVTASPKGLVAGLYKNGEAYELVPDKGLGELRHVIESIPRAADWKWILVVEKEATFKSLVETHSWLENETIGRGVLVTGRGYPDLATQRLVRAFADQQVFQSPSMPGHQPLILGLFDCDPDGVKILDIYRNGSKSLAHERSYHVPEMKWLGVKPSDIFAVGRDDTGALPLTVRDVSKIKSMLVADTERPLGTGLGVECRSALQWMRMLNRKTEIQALEYMPGAMEYWLFKRIEREFAAVS